MAIIQDTIVPERTGVPMMQCMECSAAVEPTIIISCSERDHPQPFILTWRIDVRMTCPNCGLHIRAIDDVDTQYASQLHSGAIAMIADRALFDAYRKRCEMAAQPEESPLGSIDNPIPCPLPIKKVEHHFVGLDCVGISYEDATTQDDEVRKQKWLEYFKIVQREMAKNCGLPDDMLDDNEPGIRAGQFEKNLAPMFKEIDNGILCHELAAIAVYARKLLIDNDAVTRYGLSVIDEGLDEYFKRYPNSSLRGEY